MNCYAKVRNFYHFKYSLWQNITIHDEFLWKFTQASTYFRVQKIVKRDNSCTICLEALNNLEHSINSSGESALGLLKCGHIFHFECIWRWLRAHFNCPVCRTRANMSLDDINVISMDAFEKAMASKTLPAYYREKANKKKIKKAASKESVATSPSGGESDCSSPGVNSGGDRSSGASANFIILEGGNIGESDETLNAPVSPKFRPKFRPNVRTHRFKKKSEQDMQTLSLTSLASIPESDVSEVDLTANTCATMPSFGHPVVMGKFTSPMDLKKNQHEDNSSEQYEQKNNPQPDASGSQSDIHSPNNLKADKNNVVQFTKFSESPNCDNKNHLANYSPTMQQLQKLETFSHSSLWSSQQSHYSDGVISMLNLVQEQQQTDIMMDAVLEEVNRTTSTVFIEEDKCLGVAPDVRGDNMVESTPDDLDIPKSIRSNWILRET